LGPAWGTDDPCGWCVLPSSSRRLIRLPRGKDPIGPVPRAPGHPVRARSHGATPVVGLAQRASAPAVTPGTMSWSSPAHGHDGGAATRGGGQARRSAWRALWPWAPPCSRKACWWHRHRGGRGHHVRRTPPSTTRPRPCRGVARCPCPADGRPKGDRRQRPSRFLRTDRPASTTPPHSARPAAPCAPRPLAAAGCGVPETTWPPVGMKENLVPRCRQGAEPVWPASYGPRAVMRWRLGTPDPLGSPGSHVHRVYAAENLGCMRER